MFELLYLVDENVPEICRRLSMSEEEFKRNFIFGLPRNSLIVLPLTW